MSMEELRELVRHLKAVDLHTALLTVDQLEHLLYQYDRAQELRRGAEVQCERVRGWWLRGGR